MDDLSVGLSSQLHDLSLERRDFSLRLQRFDDGLNDIRKNISTIVSQVTFNMLTFSEHYVVPLSVHHCLSTCLSVCQYLSPFVFSLSVC